MSKWDGDEEWLHSYNNKAVIVGNGDYSAPSNAYSLDWDGTGHFAGDVYVGCNNDSTGGTKVATASGFSGKSLRVFHVFP